MLILLVRQIRETLHCFLCGSCLAQKTILLLLLVLKVAVAGINNLQAHGCRVTPGQTLDGRRIPGNLRGEEEMGACNVSRAKESVLFSVSLLIGMVRKTETNTK